MAEKIKILFLAANPVAARSILRVDKEAREIKRRIQSATVRDSFEIISERVMRVPDLQEALLMHTPDIVHFSGQRGKNKGITFEGLDGDMTTISGRALARLFRVLKDHLRIIFFNGYLSREQIAGLHQAIDFTIVTNALGDEAGVVFASYFYQALAFGQSVPDAFELAMLQLDFEGIAEAKTPMMLVRKGIDTSKAYLIEQARLEKSAAVRSIKRPPKQGNITIADAARAVWIVTNNRTTKIS